MEKKVLIVDPLSYSGHVNYNHGIIRAISKKYGYKIITNQYIAGRLVKKGVSPNAFEKTYPDDWNISNLSHRIKNKYLYNILFRYYYLKVVLSVRRIVKDYDAVLFTCVEVYSFMLVSWLFGKNCFVVDHGIGNISTNVKYRIAWKTINNRIHLIVLEPFIKNMVEKVIRRTNVSVVRHPLPILCNEIDKRKEKSNFINIFAPSGGNDVKFIEQLINTSIPDNFRVIAKCGQLEHKSERLFIYKGFISDSDYKKYFMDATYLLLPYESRYNYRISAVLFEAMVMGIPVLLLANNTLKYYSDIFNGMVCLFSTVEEMFVKAQEFESHNVKLSLYTDEALSNSLLNIIN